MGLPQIDGDRIGYFVFAFLIGMALAIWLSSGPAADCRFRCWCPGFWGKVRTRFDNAPQCAGLRTGVVEDWCKQVCQEMP